MKLGRRQTELAEWAIEPMFNFWCTSEGAWDRDGKQYADSDLPTVNGNDLQPSKVKEINEDFVWRLREQFPTMDPVMPEDIEAWKLDVPSAIALADRIDCTHGLTTTTE